MIDDYTLCVKCLKGGVSLTLKHCIYLLIVLSNQSSNEGLCLVKHPEIKMQAWPLLDLAEVGNANLQHICSCI